MTRRRRQAPSKERYAKAHPPVTAHLDVETYAQVQALHERSGLSFAELLRRSLGVVAKDVETVRLRGYEEGLKKGTDLGYAAGFKAGCAQTKARYAITYACCLCGLDCELAPASEDAKVAAEALWAAGWAHQRCLDEKARTGSVVYKGRR